MTIAKVLKIGADGQMRPRARAASFRDLTSALRQYLQLVGTMHRENRKAHLDGFRFGSSEELILETTKPVWGNLDEMILPPMRVKECFANARRVSKRDPSLRYCEGFALMDGSIPTHHAWNLDADGRPQDATWPSVYRSHADRQPAKRWSGRVVYMGLTVERDVHDRWVERTGYPNLLAVYDRDCEELLRDGPEILR